MHDLCAIVVGVRRWEQMEALAPGYLTKSKSLTTNGYDFSIVTQKIKITLKI